ncbi:MAG TPA: glycosyltransferase family 4 protein [Candidatus Acidoferrales bacterium]|nr:glycosyltransferase family 4 protein [Candidatus Acidoferrales bacterium]
MSSAHAEAESIKGTAQREDDPRRPLRLIALGGRLDSPTDGVRDYCELLSKAFARRGDHLEIVQLRWEIHGWWNALRTLWNESRAWKKRIVLLQYTALMWSRRGFPFGALAVLAILKFRRVRLCVVFHDAEYAPARGVLRRLRVACQNFVLRIAFRCAEFPALTVPASQLNWLPRSSARAVFIPVGANFPAAGAVSVRTELPAIPTVAVFGVTGGAHAIPEARNIAHAMKHAAARIMNIRLAVFGRGALEAESALRNELGGSNVGLRVFGVLPGDEVREHLTQAGVLLFVRGPISSRRGSAIAGIACGLPVVGYRGPETAPPITEAGVLLVESNDREALAESLVRVLTNQELYAELSQRSVAAAEKYFSWDSIAAQFAQAFTGRE